jgi:hypothetical protein
MKFHFSTAKDQNGATSKPITASDIYHLIWGPAEETAVSDTEIQNYICPSLYVGVQGRNLLCRTDARTKADG